MAEGFLRNRYDGGVRWPIAFAHRGFSRDGLENSLQAFKNAAALGYGYVETDVHSTSDGVVVLFHDETLDRVTDGSGRIEDHTYAELRNVRIGGREPVPTLDELLTALPGICINIDIKDASSIRPLKEVLDRHDAYDRVCISSFSDRRVMAFEALVPGHSMTTSAGRLRVAAFVALSRLGCLWPLKWILRGVDALQVPVQYGRIPIVNAASVARAHQLGLQVHVWTINDVQTMNDLLDLGVDGVMTDRADLLADIMAARREWPQRAGSSSSDA
ncbi:glycerophosphodiester phosphodiesterase [Arthrobacter castelli]|uniref:glycerophosphodiester phosphodiesterase n=1 Tax=Arthrobacter castelli TaxID=271431 RepID=UPI000414BE5C|nr:glycerophosphodiester phosphodiesterase [Arthrobacter castelli]